MNSGEADAGCPKGTRINVNPANSQENRPSGLAFASVRSSDAVLRQALAAGTRGMQMTGHTDAVRAVTCAELDGVPVAVTGSADRTVRVWDLRTGTQIAPIVMSEPHCLAVTANGDLNHWN